MQFLTSFYQTARAGGKSSGTMTMDMMDFTLKVNTLGTFNVSKQVAQVIAKQEPFTEDGENQCGVVSCKAKKCMLIAVLQASAESSSTPHRLHTKTVKPVRLPTLHQKVLLQA
jgi:hypothetical protein